MIGTISDNNSVDVYVFLEENDFKILKKEGSLCGDYIQRGMTDIVPMGLEVCLVESGSPAKSFRESVPNLPKDACGIDNLAKVRVEIRSSYLKRFPGKDFLEFRDGEFPSKVILLDSKRLNTFHSLAYNEMKRFQLERYSQII